MEGWWSGGGSGSPAGYPSTRAAPGDTHSFHWASWQRRQQGTQVTLGPGRGPLPGTWPRTPQPRPQPCPCQDARGPLLGAVSERGQEALRPGEGPLPSEPLLELRDGHAVNCGPRQWDMASERRRWCGPETGRREGWAGPGCTRSCSPCSPPGKPPGLVDAECGTGSLSPGPHGHPRMSRKTSGHLAGGREQACHCGQRSGSAGQGPVISRGPTTRTSASGRLGWGAGSRSRSRSPHGLRDRAAKGSILATSRTWPVLGAGRGPLISLKLGPSCRRAATHGQVPPRGVGD